MLANDPAPANCGTSGADDFLEFEGAVPSPAGSGSQFSVGDGNRFCGRWMGLAPPSTSAPSFTYSASNAGSTVCTRQVPYRMRVHFRSDQTTRNDNSKDKIVVFAVSIRCSDGEVLSSTAANVCGTTRPTAGTADTSDECARFRLYGNRAGTLGFQFTWWQETC